MMKNTKNFWRLGIALDFTPSNEIKLRAMRMLSKAIASYINK